MARFINSDDFGKGPNCLMYALSGLVQDTTKAEEIFHKAFKKSKGNGEIAFDNMCNQLNIKLRKTTEFSKAIIAIAWFEREITERDYEGLYHTIGTCLDYHVIRKLDNGTWTEKNHCFRDCAPTNVPENELNEWNAGSTSSTQMAYYAL